MLPVVGLFALTKIPLLAAGLGIAVASGIMYYWKTHKTELDKRVIESLISQSNTEQNNVLINRCNDLARSGYRDYGVTLASFLKIKKQIEGTLEENNEYSKSREKVENLVDTLCFEVSEELTQLVALQKKKRWRKKTEAQYKNIASRIQSAYQILENTWEDLDQILDPTYGLEGTQKSKLDSVIQELEEENTLSKKIRERIQTEINSESLMPQTLSDPDFNDQDLKSSSEH